MAFSPTLLSDTVGSLGSLSQTISTTVGQNYRLSYDFLSDGQFPNEFQVLQHFRLSRGTLLKNLVSLQQNFQPLECTS